MPNPILKKYGIELEEEPNPILEKYGLELEDRPIRKFIGRAMEGAKEVVSNVPAQVQDLLTMPARVLGTPHPPMVSKLATETLPLLAEKATTPIGKFTIPPLTAKNIKSVFTGKGITETADIEPTPLDIGIMGLVGAGTVGNIANAVKFNKQLGEQLIRPVAESQFKFARRAAGIEPWPKGKEPIDVKPIIEPKLLTQRGSVLIPPEGEKAIKAVSKGAAEVGNIASKAGQELIKNPELIPIFTGKAPQPTEGKVISENQQIISQIKTIKDNVTDDIGENSLDLLKKVGISNIDEVAGVLSWDKMKRFNQSTENNIKEIYNHFAEKQGSPLLKEIFFGNDPYNPLKNMSGNIEGGGQPDNKIISKTIKTYQSIDKNIQQQLSTPTGEGQKIVYHATTKENADKIRQEGITQGMVSDTKADAEEYAQMLRNRGNKDVEVVELKIPQSQLESRGVVKTVSGKRVGERFNVIGEGQKPPVEPPKTAVGGEPAPEEPQRPKINIETIRPDQYGKTPISKAIEKMQDRIARVTISQDALNEIETIRKEFIRRITKYKDNFLKEELTGIPSIYIIKKGGIKPDEAMEELRNMGVEITDEVELKQFLQNLESQKKNLEKEIQAYKPQLVTKKETTLLYDKIKSFEQGLREGKIRTMDETRRIQTEVIELLETANLEPKDKVKFLRTLKNIQSVGQLKSSLQEITDRIYTIKGQSERSQAIQDLRDLFNRLPTENLPLDYKEKIDTLKDTIELKTRRPSTQKRLESMRQFVERMEANGEEINIPEEKLNLLDKHTVDEFTTEQLIDLQETLQRFYHLGRLKNQLLTTQQNRKVEDIVSEIVNIVTKSKGLSTEGSFIEALKRENKTLVGKTKEEIYDFILKNLRPEVLINALDDYKKGLPTQVIWDILVKANNTELENGFTSTRRLWNIFKNIDVPAAYVKKYNIGRFKNITKNNALFIYAHSKNDASLQHLYASGLTDKDIEIISNSLSIQEKGTVDRLWEYYDKIQWPRIDDVYSDIEGIHLGKEDYYFPIMRLERVSESYNRELEKELLKRFSLRQAGVTKGFTKERVNLPESAFSNFDFFGTLLRNHEQVEHYVSFAREIRDARKILYNPDVRASIEQKFGKDYYKVLDKWFKDVSYGGNKADLTWLDGLSSFLTENYVTSVLGYNLISSLKSGASYLAGVDMIGTQASLKGLIKFSQHPLAIIKFINNKSVMMKNRDFTQEREWKKILAGREAFLGQAKAWQKFKEKSAFPMMLSDKVTVYPLWISAYDDYISKGNNELKAIEWADTVVRRTQPMGQPLYLPETFRSPGIAKTYTLFTNQLNQNFNRMYEQISKFGKGKIGAGELSKTTLYLMILSGLLIGYLARRRAPTIGEFVADSVSQVAGGIVLVGRLVDSLGRAITSGRPAKLSEAISPITFRPAESVGYALTAKKPETRIKHALTAASLFTGVPFVEIKRIMEGNPVFGKGEIERQPKFTGHAKNPILEKYKLNKVTKKNPVLEKYNLN